MKNVVPMLRKLGRHFIGRVASVHDDGSGGVEPGNNSEIGGKFDIMGNYDYSSIVVGKVGNPSVNTKLEIDWGDFQYSTWHIHNSGKTGKYSWVQFPTKQDQSVSKGLYNYVLPMSLDVSYIYIYDYRGIQATVPKTFFNFYSKPTISYKN